MSEFEITEATTKKAIIDEIRDCQKALGRPLITDWRTRGMHKDDLVEILRGYELDLSVEDDHEVVVVDPEMEARLQAVIDATRLEDEDVESQLIKLVEAEAPAKTPRQRGEGVVEGERWCSWHKCGHALVVDGKPTFSVNTKMKDGLDGRCKVGWSEYKQARKPAKA